MSSFFDGNSKTAQLQASSALDNGAQGLLAGLGRRLIPVLRSGCELAPRTWHRFTTVQPTVFQTEHLFAVIRATPLAMFAHIVNTTIMLFVLFRLVL